MQFNRDGQQLGGSANLTWDGTTLNSTAARILNISIANDLIENAIANRDLVLRGSQGQSNVVIASDLAVLGRPKGTAPYVTGVLYVTMDGDDANDGLTEDRAKATISAAAAAATNQIIFRGWTYATIFVRSGVYKEPNPVLINSGITIVGDNLRAVTVQPQNPYADILWLNPKTYVTGITFRGHRFPAAAVAFPADGTTIISDLHDWASPYVQNCSSITLGKYNTDGTLAYEPGIGMVVDGQRGRKLSLSGQSNITVPQVDTVIGNDTVTIYKSLVPTLGSTMSPGWFLQQGVVGTPATVLAITSTTVGSAPAWAIQLNADLLNGIEIDHWDAVESQQSVIVLDSTYPDLNLNLAIDWAMVDPGLTAAQTLLNINQQFIQSEVVAYLVGNFPDVNFNLTQAYADAGSVLQAVISDMLSGTRQQSTAVGASIGQGLVINGTASRQDRQYYVDTINYIKDICLNTLVNQAQPSPYQDSVSQIIYPWVTGGVIGSAQVITCIANVCQIISLGPKVDLFGNASRLWVSNGAFLQAEYIAYLQTNLPTWQFLEAQLTSMIELMLLQINNDILTGGHSGAVAAGLDIYQQLAPVWAPWTDQLVAAMSYIKSVAVDVVNNTAVARPYQRVVAQTFGWAESGSTVAYQTVSDAFDIVISIMQHGPSAKPHSENIYNGFFQAYQLLQMNRQFLQYEVQSYVTNYAFPGSSIDTAALFIDIGLIVDYVCRDVYLGGTSNATLLGLSYWNQGVNGLQGQLTAFIDCVNLVLIDAQKIVANIAVSPIYQVTYPQNFDLALTNGAIADNRMINSINTLVDIVQYGPSAAAPVPAISSAVNLLRLNTSFMLAEVQAYLAARYPSLNSYVTLTNRYTNYIINSSCYDLNLATSGESIQAGLYIQSQIAANQPVGSQLAYGNAFAYLQSLMDSIVTNTLWPSPYQSAVAQTVDTAYSNGDIAIDMMDINTNLIISIVVTGRSAAVRPAGYGDASSLIGLNSNFLIAEGMAWMNSRYPLLAFSREIVSAQWLAMLTAWQADVLSGGWVKTLAWAQSLYQGTALTIAARQGETTAAIVYITSLAQAVITNTAVVSPLQTQVPQVIDTALPDGSIATGDLIAASQLVQDIIAYGDGSGVLVPQGYVDASGLIIANQNFLGAKAVAYTIANSPLLVFNEDQFASAFAILSVAWGGDLVTAADYQSKAWALNLWSGNSSTVSPELLAAYDSAIAYVGGLLPNIITNTVISDGYPVLVNQVINGTTDGAAATTAVTDLSLYVYQIVYNGPNTQRPIYLDGSVVVANVTATVVKNSPAWMISFETSLGGQIFGPFNLITWAGPCVFSPPGSIRPYVGQGLSSMVLDSFTQYNEVGYTPVLPNGAGIDPAAIYHGGQGIVISNAGYAQLVSIFEICCNIGVLCLTGGQCSITNSNTDFGNYGLWADGVSDLQYSCKIYGGNQGPSSFLITDLPTYNTTTGAYKQPYAGQVITIGKYLADFGYSCQQFFYIDYITVTDGGLGYDPNKPPTINIPNPSIYSGGYAAQARAILAEDTVSGLYYVAAIAVVVSGSMFTPQQIASPGFITISAPQPGGAQAYAVAIGYPIYYTITASTTPNIYGQTVISTDQNIPYTVDNDAVVNFYQVSKIITSAHSFEYIGTGTDIATAIPARGGVPIVANQVVMTNGGFAAYTSTNELGNFNIGPGLVINQDTGTISGRTFEKSLFAIMTPYILSLQ